MKIRYLGTGAAEGIPALFCVCNVCRTARELGGHEVRTRSGAIIDGALKLDFPPDTYHHLLTYGLDITHLEHLLITHPHEDHYQVADLLYRVKGFGVLDDGAKPLTVYGGKEVGELLKTRFDNRQDAEQYVRFTHMEPFKTVNIGGYDVTALPSRHARQFESFIYLISKDGQNLLYAHDSGVFFDEVYDFLAGRAIDFISLDCTYMDKDTRDQPENGHMGLPVNHVVREKLLEIGAATPNTTFVVNHFSHNGGLNHAALVDAAEGFIVTHDGMELEV